jgi:2C-methyl-D-erythritol 2,4-cyclodiphosphate synthase
VSPEQIGLKGKTGESVGIIGREEAIIAQCVALLVRG